MTTKRQRVYEPRARCKQCGSAGKLSHSFLKHQDLRLLYFICENYDCSFRWREDQVFAGPVRGKANNRFYKNECPPPTEEFSQPAIQKGN